MIEAVLAGDAAQFEELVRRYQRPLLQAAGSRLGRWDVAEDAVQETFLCAFKSLASYNSAYSFRTWLWTILLNQCRRQAQRTARWPRVVAWSDEANRDAQPAELVLCNQAAPADRLLADERAAQLSRLLAELPEAQADALRLRFFGQLKFHEIAAALDCTVGAAKQRVRAGLLKMGQRIDAEPALQEVCAPPEPTRTLP